MNTDSSSAQGGEFLDALVEAIDETVSYMGDALEHVTRGNLRGFAAWDHFLETFEFERNTLESTLRLMTLKKSIKKRHLIRINESIARIYGDALLHRSFFERLTTNDQSQL